MSTDNLSSEEELQIATGTCSLMLAIVYVRKIQGAETSKGRRHPRGGYNRELYRSGDKVLRWQLRV